MSKYINKNTFEIINNPDFFEVDDEIAETVIILNKKGYKTNYSCAGHNKSGFLYTTQKEPVEFLKEWLKKYGDDVTTNYLGKDSEYFYHKDEVTVTYTYISFEKKYEFEILPDGFESDDTTKYFNIGKMCYFYKNNDTKNRTNRKTDYEIDEELNKAQKDLLVWAKKLKSIL